jgi:hypothetical protein
LDLFVGAGEAMKGFTQADMQKKLLEAQLLGQEAEAEYRTGLLGLKEKEFERAGKEFEWRKEQAERAQMQATQLEGIKTLAGWLKQRSETKEAKTERAHELELEELKTAGRIREKGTPPAPTPKAQESLLDRIFKTKERALDLLIKQKGLEKTTEEIENYKFNRKMDQAESDLAQDKFNLDKMSTSIGLLLDVGTFEQAPYMAALKAALDKGADQNLSDIDKQKLNVYTNLLMTGARMQDPNIIALANTYGKEVGKVFAKYDDSFKPMKVEFKTRRDWTPFIGGPGFLRKSTEVIETPFEGEGPVSAAPPQVSPAEQGRQTMIADLLSEGATGRDALSAGLRDMLSGKRTLEDILEPAAEAPAIEMPTNPMDLGTSIKESANAAGLDLPLIMAMMKAESTFKPDAKSSVGAVGLLQLMPKTAESLGLSVDERTEPMKNITAGIAYLEQLKGRFASEEEMLAAYNAGPSRAKSPPKETKAYIAKVQKDAEAYRKDVNLLYKDLQTLYGNITGTPGEPTKMPVPAHHRGELPYYQTPTTSSPTTPQAYTIEWAIGMFVRAGRNKLKPEDIKSLKAKGFSDDDIEDIKDGIK